MRTSIVRIGNSQGIRIPKAIIEQEIAQRSFAEPATVQTPTPPPPIKN